MAWQRRSINLCQCSKRKCTWAVWKSKDQVGSHSQTLTHQARIQQVTCWIQINMLCQESKRSSTRLVTCWTQSAQNQTSVVLLTTLKVKTYTWDLWLLCKLMVRSVCQSSKVTISCLSLNYSNLRIIGWLWVSVLIKSSTRASLSRSWTR